MILNRFDYKIDFMSKRRIWMVISIVLMLVCLGSLVSQWLVLGIDFTGGTVVEVSYTKAVELEAIRSTLHDNGFADAVAQHFGTTQDILIRLGVHEDLDNQTLSNQILGLLQQEDKDVVMNRVEFVGPQIGEELVADGGLAVLYTLIGILIYVTFRFEYRFALGAVAALIHDTMLTVGLFSLFRWEFDLTVLAAVLAVIGYSLNDTIVVFDRIRDNFLKMRKQNATDIINASINQILGRTIMTSFTTLVVVFVLFLFGGELIHGFSMALMIGIIVGTYSSIYIASAAALALGVSRSDLAPVPKEGADMPDQGP